MIDVTAEQAAYAAAISAEATAKQTMRDAENAQMRAQEAFYAARKARQDAFDTLMLAAVAGAPEPP